MKCRAIVVATDGTATSRAAITWAAREAQRRSVPLRVAHVFDWGHCEARYEFDSEYLERAREMAAAVTSYAVQEARAVAPGLTVEGDPLIGHAAARLLAETSDASLMVLGSRGSGGFVDLQLGSVSQRVATHARCPVVVVRGRGDAAGGPVAVGVDDSAVADDVLAVAFEEAAERNAAIVAVRAHPLPLPVLLGEPTEAAVASFEADAEERTRLEERLGPWRDKYPQVSVEVVLTHESAASALVTASQTAQLVVVGSQGRGGTNVSALGLVGLQLLQHSDCPVYVVRPESCRPTAVRPL